MTEKHQVQTDGLRPVLEMTRQMQGFAETAMWDELIALEKQRDQRIKNIKSFEKARPIIEQILAMDTSIKQLAEEERARVKAQLMQLNKGKTAIQAYSA